MHYVDDEKRWRHALELVGRERVEDLLRRYPGAPSDPVSDLPVQAPFPTREFCRQWCVATTSQVARSYATVGITMVLMTTLAVSYAACSLSRLSTPAPNTNPAAGAGPVAPRQATGPAADVQVPTVSGSSIVPRQSPSSGSDNGPPPIPGTFQVQTVTAGQGN